MKSKASDQAGKKKPAATNNLDESKSKKVKTIKAKSDPLAMCPVDGAGWCPYPFSVAQLKKRLKAKAAGLA